MREKKIKVEELGTSSSRAILYFLLKHFGKPGIWLIMFPTVTYFILTKSNLRRNSLNYWKGLYPDRSFGFYLYSIYKQYISFGLSLIDRILVQKNPQIKLVLSNPAGQDIIQKEIQKGKPVILLCSHYGGYNLYRFLSEFITNPIHLLIYINPQEVEAYSMADRSAFGNINLIDPSNPLEALFRAKQVLEKKGILVVMGDRINEDNPRTKKRLTINRLSFDIPYGPWKLACLTEASIIPIFIKKEKKKYQFLVYPPISFHCNNLDGPSMQNKIQKGIQEYKIILEEVLFSDPAQYYNFGTEFSNY